jgi:pimeloyl-ACP methyl ester carboxylesterase
MNDVLHQGGRDSGAARRVGSTLGAGLVAAPLAWLAYSRFVVNHHVPLPDALPGIRRRFRSERAGQLSYYAVEEGRGRPLVLIHSVNVAASAYEWLPLWERYRHRRPVYALDLPGFGFSERGERAYAPALYAAAIADFLKHELAEEEPADLVALSLGAEFAALASLEQPDRVASLALVSPTGFGRGGASERMTSGGSERVHQVLAVPLWSQAFYDLLVTRPSLRWFLERSFVGRVDDGLVDYAWRTAHQPGARFAPIYFLSGALFTPDVREQVYERITQPALVLYDRDPYVSFDELSITRARCPNWRAVRIVPTRGLPHFERPEDTEQALERFWSQYAAGNRSEAAGV